jgi:hypothetical protein
MVGEANSPVSHFLFSWPIERQKIFCQTRQDIAAAAKRGTGVFQRRQEPAPIATRLIFGRVLVYMVNHQDLDRTFLWYQFECELIFQGFKQIRLARWHR